MYWSILYFLLKLCLRWYTCLFFLIWPFDKFQCIFMEINPLYYSTLTVYWSWLRNGCTFRSQWSTQQLTWVHADLCCAVLCCAACPAWLQAGLCRTIPWLQDKLSQLVSTEVLEGSSHLVPVITPPAWPCLYLTVQEAVLREHPLETELFSCEDITW